MATKKLRITFGNMEGAAPGESGVKGIWRDGERIGNILQVVDDVSGAASFSKKYAVVGYEVEFCRLADKDRLFGVPGTERHGVFGNAHAAAGDVVRATLEKAKAYVREVFGER
jgi:hypothetical protein